jgi:hypothetical protein
MRPGTYLAYSSVPKAGFGKYFYSNLEQAVENGFFHD